MQEMKEKHVTRPKPDDLPMKSFFKSFAATVVAGGWSVYCQSPWFEKALSGMPSASAAEAKIVAYAGIFMAAGIAALHAYDVLTYPQTPPSSGGQPPRLER